jgi:hypothetical protein
MAHYGEKSSAVGPRASNPEAWPGGHTGAFSSGEVTDVLIPAGSTFTV